MFAMIAYGQRVPQVTPTNNASVEQISLANPYIGAAKLSYNFDQDKPLNDNLLFSATVQLTPIQGERFALPIVGVAGLGSGDMFNPGSGLNIGVYPYYILTQSETVKLVAHGGVAYKVITQDVGVEDDAPQQVKLLGGLEVIYGDAGKLPMTLSVTPAYLHHSVPEMESVGVLEATAVIPVAAGLAVLVEGLVPFNNSFNGQFRFAVITTMQ